MKYKLLLLFLVLVTALSACNKTQENTLKENSNSQKIQDVIVHQNEEYENNYKNFIKSNDVVLDFINAYLDKDFEKMREYVTSEILISIDGISSEANEETIPYIDKTKLSYKINSFGYDSDKEEMFIQIFLEDTINMKSYGFINFELKSQEEEKFIVWKIINIETDI
jgi:predicted lipid-binding transport protein (Tim44 family)